MVIYGRRFDPVRLKSEHVALYCDAEFHRKVNELREYIRQQELEDVFPQAYKLAKLILTIRAISVSTERSFSALKRIKNYLHNTQCQERLSFLSQLNIESRLLDRLMSKPAFIDDVIDIFATNQGGSTCTTNQKVRPAT
jgi:hypothetical protein